MNNLPNIEKRKSDDMLIIADDVAWQLNIQNSDTKILRPTDGFEELDELITEGYVDVSDFKVIVLIIGRQDLAKSNDIFEHIFRNCLKTIQDRNPGRCYTSYTNYFEAR